MTADQITVCLPGKASPVDLDTYADIVAAIAGFGTEAEQMMLPDHFAYENPKTGGYCTVESAIMTRSN